MANISEFRCGSCDGELERELEAPCRCGGQAVATYDMDLIRQQPRPGSTGNGAGIWRYAVLLPIAKNGNVSYGEGDTPLRSFTAPSIGYEGRIDLKMDGRNPTGSCEDRGMACAVASAKQQGFNQLRLNSAGVSAVSASAYSTLTGASMQISMSRRAPASMLIESRLFGSELHAAAEITPDERLFGWRAGQTNASCLNAYRIEGLKTIGFEIAEQLGWQCPDVVVCPFGTGLLTFSVWKSFTELREVGWVGGAMPRVVSVQAQDPWRTVAKSLSALRDADSELAGRAVRESGGTTVKIEDEAIIEAALEFAKRAGVLVSAEGAAGLACLQRLQRDGYLGGNERVVVIDPIDGRSYGETFGRYLPRAPRGKEDKLGGLITPR